MSCLRNLHSSDELTVVVRETHGLVCGDAESQHDHVSEKLAEMPGDTTSAARTIDPPLSGWIFDIAFGQAVRAAMIESS